jgi:hypothetical protein
MVITTMVGCNRNVNNVREYVTLQPTLWHYCDHLKHKHNT